MLQTPHKPQSYDTLKKQFDEDGYCIAKGHYSESEVADIIDLFEGLHAEALTDSSYHEYFKPVSKEESGGDPLLEFPRFIHPHRFSDRAKQHMLKQETGDLLTHMLEDEAIAVQSMFYYKPPGAKGQALHQDNVYLLVEPVTCIAAWTAIDYCDPDNGGMYIVPGSHRIKVECPVDIESEDSFVSHTVPIPKGMKAVPAIMEPGDTLFFNGSVIHGSGPNRTEDRWRRSFITHHTTAAAKKISHYYRPCYHFNGEVFEIDVNEGGGPCGSDWKGAAGY